jgi:hypothetical protein
MEAQTHEAIEKYQDSLKSLPEKITLGDFSQNTIQFSELTCNGLTAIVAISHQKIYQDVMLAKNPDAGIKGMRPNQKLISAYPDPRNSGAPAWLKISYKFSSVEVIDYNAQERFEQGGWVVERNQLPSNTKPSIDIKITQELALLGCPVPIGVLGHSDHRGLVTILTESVTAETILQEEIVFQNGEKKVASKLSFKDYLLKHRNKGNEKVFEFTATTTLNMSQGDTKITLTRLATKNEIEQHNNELDNNQILRRLSAYGQN